MLDKIKSGSLRTWLILVPLAFAGCTTLDISYLDPKTDQAFIAEKESERSPPPVVIDPVEIDVKGQKVIRFPVGDSGATRFHRGDQIKVSIWGYSELDHVAEVQPNGRITIPLVGEVYAEGESPEVLRLKITQLLKPYSAKTANAGLREGDTLRLFVWGHPELSYIAKVQPNGKITLPMVGSVSVLDRSLESLQKVVQRKLRAFIKDPNAWLMPESQERLVLLEPKVSVLPWKLKSRTFAVLGEVVVPGLQKLSTTTRVIDALSMAQIKETASWNDVVVIRNYNTDKPGYRRLRLKDFMNGTAPEQNIFLRANDIVMVPKTPLAEIGMYIDHFFNKTRPVFDWWVAGVIAANIHDSNRLTHEHQRLSIDGLQRQILDAEQATN